MCTVVGMTDGRDWPSIAGHASPDSPGYAGGPQCLESIRPRLGGAFRTIRLVAFSIAIVSAASAQPTVTLDEPAAPPPWALAERLLLDTASEGTQAFFAKYVNELGYLKCVERWGGNDGADDAMENFGGWTLLHSLGGSEDVLTLYKRAWEGHIRQYTEARAPGIEMAEHGMYWREFVTSFDWEHTGEALAAFYLYGLALPDDTIYRFRATRSAEIYTGQDPLADNYDADRKIVKSLHNGSRGAKLTPASEMDWGGLPVEGNPERLTRYATASNIRGDHPLNLCATALGLNAYALSGEERFRDWVLEYATAWRDRVLENDGNIPTNIGLDGSIGGEWGGKWYGGVFGWDFWPQSDGRNYFIRGPRIAFGIGVLLTGDRSFMEPLRRQIANLYAAKRIEGGRVLLPRKHGDTGFYGYTADEHLDVQRDVYLFTADRSGLDGLARDPWIRYLEGDNSGYPLDALHADIETVRSRLEGIRKDSSIDYQRPSDYSQRFNPAVTDSLVKLMLGGNPPGRAGNVLHARLFYYDPVRSRPGLPDGVAALVEGLTPDSVRFRLVNLDPVNDRRVVVQAGAYGEHRFTEARAGSVESRVDGDRFEVLLAPGAGGMVQVGMHLFANRPRFRPMP